MHLETARPAEKNGIGYADMVETIAEYGPVDYALVYRALEQAGVQPDGVADGYDAALVIGLGYDVHRASSKSRRGSP